MPLTKTVSDADPGFRTAKYESEEATPESRTVIIFGNVVSLIASADTKIA